MKVRQTITTLTAIACLSAIGTALTSCSSDVAATLAEQSPASDEITVAPFPSYAAETRAVPGAPTSEKSEWTEGDVIFVQVNDGDWKSMEYTADGWDTTGISISKGNSYKAVYAPNYEISDGELKLKEGKTGSTGEYLVSTGISKPIEIEFTRTYSRLRIYLGEDASTTSPVKLTFGDGFTTNDGSERKTIQLQPKDGNAYVYGSWKDGTSLTIRRDISGDSSKDAVYVVEEISNEIEGTSVKSKSYATDFTDAETWVIDDLDNANAAVVSDWTEYTQAGYTNLKVLGIWDKSKAPTFSPMVLDVYDVSVLVMDLPSGKGYDTLSKFTHIDLSNVSGLTQIDNYYFSFNAKLKQIDLPKDLQKIGIGAFRGCSSLVIKRLPDTVSTIDYEAFKDCYSLNIEILPINLTTLNNYAFEKCTIKFTSLPSSLKQVGGHIFRYAIFAGNDEKSFEWPSGIGSIPWYTFEYSNLEKIIIPSDVTVIGEGAFSEALKTVICYATEAPQVCVIYDDNEAHEVAFEETVKEQMTLYVPKSAISTYQDSDWAQYFNEIKSIESLSTSEN